jgi:hypothetical protein
MLLSHHQNAGQKAIKMANRSLENVAQFKYLGMTVTDQNLIQVEIKSKLNLDYAYYHSVQNLVSSHLLSKNVKIRIYKTIILPMVLYRCETWYLTLKEEHRLRVLGNRLLRRISGPKRDEVKGGWRKLHNEDLHNFYSSPSIITMIKPKGKRPLGRPRHRWVENIKMDLREIGLGGMHWIDLAQDRNIWRALLNTIMNLWVPYIAVKLLSIYRIGSYTGRTQLHEVRRLICTKSLLTLQRRGLCTAWQRCLPHVAEVRALHGSVALSFSSYF